MIENRKVVLRARPRGTPTEADFGIEAETGADPAPRQVVIEVSDISIDAFIRTKLDDRGMHGTIPLGATIPALGVGRIRASASGDFALGD